jgi:hypothetical protein
MKNQLSPMEQLCHSTVRIECDFPDGSRGTGSGFFYSLCKNGDRHVPVIVTNRHVVEGAVKGRFILTLSDPDGNPLYGKNKGFELDAFSSRWAPHPDGATDLCVMPIAPLLHLADQSGDKFFFVTLDDSLLPSEEEIRDFVGLEEITMVGYPNGLWDSVNNLPICRRGVLASSFDKDWAGKKEFLIDAACFPGSSGSPVFLFNVGGYQTRNAMLVGGRLKLLGILYAGPQHTITGEVKVVTIPTIQKPISVATIPNNLGFVIKSEKIRDFEMYFKGSQN